MKTIQFLFALCCVGTLQAIAQMDAAEGSPASGTAPLVGSAQPNPDPASRAGLATGTKYAVAERGPHHKVWERSVYRTNSLGMPVREVQRYTELAVGLNHQTNGEWVDAQEIIEPLDGGAVARQGQYQVAFANSLATAGAVSMQTPDGDIIVSQVLGLSYFDKSTGNSTLIAGIKDCEGQIVGSNQVLYAEAFDGGFKCDVRYTYRKSKFEQDIILREQPPAPEEFGLSASNVVLQVLTEFTQHPEVARQAMASSSSETPTGDSGAISLGAVRFGDGKAFSTGNSDRGSEIRTRKRFVTLEGRDFLVEEVPVQAVAPQLRQLPQTHASLQPTGSAPRRQASPKRHLPKLPETAKRVATNSMQIAQVRTAASPGFVIDYVENFSYGPEYLFRGDTTYYLSDDGYAMNLVFEGGTVIKFARGVWLGSYTSDFRTSKYRPAIFTAMDDDSVGQMINGSSHSPTNYYAAAMTFGNWGNLIHDARFLYAETALEFDEGTTCNCGEGIDNAQFLHCGTAILAYDADVWVPDDSEEGGHDEYWPHSVSTRNVLIADVALAYSCGKVSAFNNTVSDCDTLTDRGWLTFNDSLFANVGALGSYDTLLGGTNGFYPSGTGFGMAVVETDDYPFQSVGGADYYLADSTFRAKGTPYWNLTVRNWMAAKTTQPPQLILNSEVSTNLTLSHYADRDTGDLVDLGFHYDPIDHLLAGVDCSATITVSPGTVIAWYEAGDLFNCSGYNDYGGYGVCLSGSGHLVMNGTAAAPCWFVRYSTVQEGKPAGWTPDDWVEGILLYFSYSALDASFVKWAAPACNDRYWGNVNPIGETHLRNCEVYGGYLWTDCMTSDFVNCLFERTDFEPYGNDGDGRGSINLRNSLFWEGKFAPTRQALWSPALPALWTIKDTAFDNTVISVSDDYNGDTNWTVCDYNAFIQNTPRLPVHGTHDVLIPYQVNGGFNWMPGPLGPYYQGKYNQYRLADKGSALASDVGLYHFTTRTNLAKDGTTIVDIGYHYVATDQNGNPLDSNTDGNPDYLQDANGNGTVEDGETPWSVGIVVPPQAQAVREGSTVTLSVVASGKEPLTYQWYWDEKAIPNATGASLTLSKVTTADVGAYRVSVHSGIQLAAASANLEVWYQVPLDAGLWNVNFGSAAPGTPKVGRAAAGKNDATDSWNNTLDGNISLQPAQAADPTAISMTCSEIMDSGEIGSPDPMYNSVVEFPPGATISLSGLPQGTYEVYVYGFACSFGLNCPSTLRDTIQASDDSDASTEPIWQEGKQFIRFCGIDVGSMEETVVLTAADYSYVSGIQLVQICTAPGTAPNVDFDNAFVKGSVLFAGTLDQTVVNTIAGRPISRPKFAQLPVFSDGHLQALAFDYACPNMWPQALSIPVHHLPGLSFDPPLPGTIYKPGVYAYTARAEGIRTAARGWWPGEDAPADIIGANDAILVNGAHYADGKVGRCFQFDGTSYGKVLANDRLDVSFGYCDAGFSVECWIRPEATDREQPILYWVDGVYLWVAAGGALCASLPDPLGETFLISSAPGKITAGSFQHVALTLDRGSSLAMLYLNGVNVATLDYYWDSINLHAKTSGDLFFGKRFGSSQPTFSGEIDEISIYDRNLDDKEIPGIFASGSHGKARGIPDRNCAALPLDCNSGPDFTNDICTVTVNVAAPVAITAQPLPVRVCAGGTASLSVKATGTQLQYQWRKNGTPIDGGGRFTGTTSSDLVITAVQTGDAASALNGYDCLVTGGFGEASMSVASASVPLAVELAPVITTQPVAQQGCSGSSAVFHVGVSGWQVQYQWRKNGVDLGAGGNISGVHTPTLVISPVDAGQDAATYDCVVSGACSLSSTNSDPVGLSMVSPTISIVAQKSDQEPVCFGGTVTLSVAAITSLPDVPLAYQWKKHGVPLADNSHISGTTTARMRISPVQASDEAIPGQGYSCEVTANAGTVTAESPSRLGLTESSIIEQPISQTVEQGDDVTFTVVTCEGSVAWEKYDDGAGNWVSLGIQTPSLVLSNVNDSQNGLRYRAQLGGGGVSDEAQLTVSSPRAYGHGVVHLIGSRQDITLRSDQTYYIDSPVQLHGITTIEGGTTVKVAPGLAATALTVAGNLNCMTGPYRIATFTSLQDNSVGTTNSRLPAVPQPTAGQTYLALTRPDTTLKYLRFAFADTAVATGVAADIWDCQFVACAKGIAASSGSQLRLHNSLFTYGDSAFSLDATSILSAEHVTADATKFADLPGGYSQIVHVTNSILIGGPTLGDHLLSDSVSINPPAPTFQASGDSQTWSGTHYLASTAACRNQGNENISPALKAELRNKTTQVPLDLPTGLEMSGDWTLYPVAPRYTGGKPDLGYYYDALDYTVANAQVLSGASVVIEPGTAIGVRNFMYYDLAWDIYPDSLAYFMTTAGFQQHQGSSIVSHGLVDKPINFTHVRRVQEGPYLTQFQLFSYAFITGYNTDFEDAGSPTLDFRFCNFAFDTSSGFAADVNLFGGYPWYPGSDGVAPVDENMYWHYYTDWPDAASASVFWTMRDCNLHGGSIVIQEPMPLDNDFEIYKMFPDGTFIWQNDLFERVYTSLNPSRHWKDGDVDHMNASIQLQAYNNLFRAGELALYPIPSTVNGADAHWVMKDNLFDGVMISSDGYADERLLEHDFNAYWVSPRLPDIFTAPANGTGQGDQSLHSPPGYQTGFFGDFYLPSSSQLVDAGSRSSAEAGLDQYTTRSDQTKESEESEDTVNIGLHYVATDSQGAPRDDLSSPYHIPDYLVVLDDSGSPIKEPTDAAYADIDLDGDGMVGRIEQALGRNPLISDNPLTLVPSSGDEPGIATFTVKVDYDNIETLDAYLQLELNGICPNLSAFSRAPDGSSSLAWNTLFDRPGRYYAQACLTLRGLGPAANVRTAKGGFYPVQSDNVIRFFEGDGMYDDAEASFFAELSQKDASYVIQLTDPSTAPPTLLKTIVGSTSDGTINTNWVFSGDPVPYGGNTIEEVVDVTLFDAAGNQTGHGGGKRAKKKAKVNPSVDGNGFDVVYFYAPYPGVDRHRSFEKDGIIWNGMLSVVDCLIKPVEERGPKYSYQSSYNCWTSEPQCPAFPGYVTSTDAIKSILYPDMANTITKSLYVSGHSSGTDIGNGAAVRMRAEDVAKNVLRNTTDMNGRTDFQNPYRFVFLDGCATASDPAWRRAFGILPLEDSNHQKKLGPQAYVGWWKNIIGWPVGHKSWREEMFNDVNDAYCHTLQAFYIMWMEGRTLKDCITEASKKDIDGRAPFPVDEYKNAEIVVKINGRTYRFPPGGDTSQIVVIGHSGLTRNSCDYSQDGKFKSPGPQ